MSENEICFLIEGMNTVSWQVTTFARVSYVAHVTMFINKGQNY